MSHMFRNCSSLAIADLSGFDTRNVRDMTEIFKGCTKLGNILSKDSRLKEELAKREP